MQLLQELNPDVNGDYVEESADFILANRPNFFDSFDLVIASNLNEQTLLLLADRLWEANVPLLYCRSLGMLGTIRLQIREHCIVEAHPDNRQFDLRLEHPFDALREHLNGTEVTGKVPWLLVLHKYLSAWQKQQANGTLTPRTYKEKNQLRDSIREEMKADEENYEEAIKAVNTAFGAGQIPSGLKAIFEDDACEQLNKKVAITYSPLFTQISLISVSLLEQHLLDHGQGSETLCGARKQGLSAAAWGTSRYDRQH